MSECEGKRMSGEREISTAKVEIRRGETKKLQFKCCNLTE